MCKTKLKIRQNVAIISTFVLGLIILPKISFAALVADCDGWNCEGEHFWSMLNNLISYAIGLAVASVTIIFIYAGYTYLTSGGDSGKVSRAHTMLRKAAIGFMIAFLAYTAVFFALDVLGFNFSFLNGILNFGN